MSGKSLRGFGAMDREKQRQIASKGGKAAHQKGTAHEFTPEEARAAGRKGGQAAHRKGTAHQFTPQEAAEAGRKGGRAAHQRGTRRSNPEETAGGNGSMNNTGLGSGDTMPAAPMTASPAVGTNGNGMANHPQAPAAPPEPMNQPPHVAAPMSPASLSNAGA